MQKEKPLFGRLNQPNILRAEEFRHKTPISYPRSISKQHPQKKSQGNVVQRITTYSNEMPAMRSNRTATIEEHQSLGVTATPE
jgi:hypothetical protein